MKPTLGPCPRCRRHVSLFEPACPFCSAPFGLSRRDFAMGAAAVATLGLAPVADAARLPWQDEQDYGVRRPEPEPAGPNPIDVVYADWLCEVGILSPGASWAAHKPGTVVSYGSSDGKAAFRANAVLTLMKVADAGVTVKAAIPQKKAEEQVFTRAAGVTKDAKVADEGKETLDVDGKRFECEIKSYELPGRTFKVWWCKDAPLGFAKVTCGEETIRLSKVSEKLKVRWGEYDCSVWETTFGGTSRKTWRCDKVPGLVVKIEEKTKDAVSLLVEITAVTEGK